MCAPIIAAGVAAAVAGGAGLAAGGVAAAAVGGAITGSLLSGQASKALGPKQSTVTVPPPATAEVPTQPAAPPAISSPVVRNSAGKATGYKTEIQVLPQVQSFSVQDAGNRERRRRARLRGENTTVATSGQGLIGPVNTGVKTLFGQ